MKKLALAIAVICAYSTPASAQQIVKSQIGFLDVNPSPAVGVLATSGDTIVLPISGAQFATVRLVIAAAESVSFNTEISLDYGTNWIASPFGKNLVVVTANPSLTTLQGVSFGGASEYEIPIPANTTHFRIRAVGSTAPAGSFTLKPGQVYVPGLPVVAVLYELGSSTGAALDTGTLDLSGYRSVLARFTSNGGVPSYTISIVDDAGASLVISTSAADTVLGWGEGTTSSAALAVPLPRRGRFQSAAIVSQTSRIRIEARR